MKITYTYWKENDGMFFGYLDEFPDHRTQGTYLRITPVAELELA